MIAHKLTSEVSSSGMASSSEFWDICDMVADRADMPDMTVPDLLGIDDDGLADILNTIQTINYQGVCSSQNQDWQEDKELEKKGA
jgi:hypothetical protein